jgi:acyl-CoA hydrolase/acetoin utilization deacetylase AcuC-like enzyme/GNAT superfamily N-acetyltransferase
MNPLNTEDWPKLLRPGSRVFIGGGAAMPLALVRSMLAHAHQLKDIELVHIHSLRASPWIAAEYESVMRTNSFFLTPDVSEAVSRGQADYTPSPMSMVPRLFREGPLQVDVALVEVSPPDAAGNCSLGVSVDVVWEAVATARWVIAQVNPQMPRTGGKSLISQSNIHYFIEQDMPLPETQAPSLDKRHELIGSYAAQLIEDGSTLQVGLGNSPEAVVRALHQHRNLGIHSGMFTNAFMDLIRKGVVNNSRKSYQPGKCIASHVLGSRELYRFVHENPNLELHPSDWVNNPTRIARNDRMVSINGARMVDLTGQVVRDSSGHHFYGGVGSMQDFFRGASKSKDGQPVIALTSRSDDDKSARIVANLAPGSGVCTSRSDIHYVVTEYGVASIFGRSIRERVARLVEIAHPDDREELLRGAWERGWVPKFFTMPGGARGELESKMIDFKTGRFQLRPLHPSDMSVLQDFFYSHDEETIRLRYGHHRERMSGESAYKLAAVDQEKDVALGVFDRKGALRAIARYYLDAAGDTAEVAFVVHETTRRAGMASVLFGELATIAAKRGIQTFWASVLQKNHAMAALFEQAGGRSKDSISAAERHFDIPVAGVLSRHREIQDQINSAKPAKAIISTLGVHYSAAYERHDTGAGHPESAERYRKLRLALTELPPEILRLPGRRATTSEIALAHESYYQDLVYRDVESFADVLRTGDTAISIDSYDVALEATGAVLSTVDAIMQQTIKRAFCAVRPPGHHATADRGMGFCIFNHVAIAAKYLKKHYPIQRIAIIDWDVHFGNGTEAIFADDPDTFYLSLHEKGNYDGELDSSKDVTPSKATLSLALPESSGASEALAAWDTSAGPALDAFQPEFVLISAGFDARKEDPLGGLKWEDETYAQLTQRVIALAEKHAEGRIVSVLEGGYNPTGLASAALAHVRAMR